MTYKFMKFKVVHIAAINKDKVTGPKNSVTLLSKAMNRSGVATEVFSVIDKDEFYFNDVRVSPFSYCCLSKCDFVLFSGIYHKIYPSIAKYLIDNGIDYGITPRSSLMLSSLAKSWYKKAFFLAFYRNSFIKKSKFLHFLSVDEKINSLFGSYEHFICPNIVTNINCEMPLRKEKLIGFLGRYDVRHKGLDRLVEALLLMKDYLLAFGYRFEFHGTDFEGGRDYLDSFVEKNELGEVVYIGDPLFGEDKNRFLNRISIFVHTSRYEGLPQAVMEAMAFSCAIAVTTGTNMKSIVEESKCGKILSDEPRNMSGQLIDLLANYSELLKMQSSAYCYAKNNFSSKEVAGAIIKEMHS